MPPSVAASQPSQDSNTSQGPDTSSTDAVKCQTLTDHVAVSDWTTDQVVAWLGSLGLDKFSSTFAENMITGQDLLELTMDELKNDLGVSALGARKEIIRQLKAVKESS